MKAQCPTRDHQVFQTILTEINLRHKGSSRSRCAVANAMRDSSCKYRSLSIFSGYRLNSPNGRAKAFTNRRIYIPLGAAGLWEIWARYLFIHLPLIVRCPLSLIQITGTRLTQLNIIRLLVEKYLRCLHPVGAKT